MTLSTAEKQQITQLVKHWVVPAIGCTEPICVALAVSRATEVLGATPVRIEAWLSANILKNAMGVGIPGTGMVGLPIAIALGALIGRSDYGLEVLRDCTPEAVEQGKAYIATDCIDIQLKKKMLPKKLYVEILTTDENGHRAHVVIAREHTRFTLVEKDDEVIFHAAETNVEQAAEQSPANEPLQLNMRKVWEYATTMPVEEIEFINEARRLNSEAARRSLEGNYGHCLGKALTRPLGRGIMGDNIFSHILSSTSCACDARMAGAMIPVMSNSGSGNQVFAPRTPWWCLPRKTTTPPEEMTRAPDAFAPHGHLHQTKPGHAVGPVRMRGGCHGIELRHYLPDGRYVRTNDLRREKT